MKFALNRVEQLKFSQNYKLKSKHADVKLKGYSEVSEKEVLKDKIN